MESEPTCREIFLLKLYGKLVLLPIYLFVWEATKGCTLINLMKKDFITVNRCFFWKNNLESCNHLLLGCSISYQLWSMVLGLLGMSWVMAELTISELLAWEGISNRNKSLRLISLINFWVI